MRMPRSNAARIAPSCTGLSAVWLPKPASGNSSTSAPDCRPVPEREFPLPWMAGRGRGWYRSDCHVRAVYSDGELTPEQVAGGAAWLRRRAGRHAADRRASRGTGSPKRGHEVARSMACGKLVNKTVDNRIQLRITGVMLWIVKKTLNYSPRALARRPGAGVEMHSPPETGATPGETREA